MEDKIIIESVRLTDLLPPFHIVSLSLLIIVVLTLTALGLKCSSKNTGSKFQCLLCSLSIWIALFGGISFSHFWFKTWMDAYFMGYPKNELWMLWQIGSYFRLVSYLSLALVGWTAAIILRLVNKNKSPTSAPTLRRNDDER